MRRLFPLTTLAAIVAATAVASAQHHQHQHVGPACTETTLACASTATPAFAADGSLFLAWSAGGRVMVAKSSDLGRSFAPTVAVNPAPAKIDGGPDARAKIAVDRDGRITVAYAEMHGDRYDGRVMVSRSLDGGASFTEPQPITDSEASQRFETLAIDPGGDLFAAWIDKRDAVAARSAGKTYPGAALAFAWSKDGGATFSRARIAVDETCECCRLGVAFAGPHRPVVAFRNVFDGHVRDHAVVAFADADTPGPMHRVSVDNWNTDICPHQGPNLALGRGDSYHIVWFTAGTERKGLFYARSGDGGAQFSAPMPVGAADRRAERPYLLAQGGKVWLVWKEFDGEGTTIRLMTSDDDGITWSAAKPVASTGDAADHPILISDGRRPYLSWLTKVEGYRLIALMP